MIDGYRTVVGQAAVVVEAVVAGRAAAVVAMAVPSRVAGRVDTAQVSSGVAVKPVGHLGMEAELPADGAHKVAGHSRVINSHSRPAGDRFDDINYLLT